MEQITQLFLEGEIPTLIHFSINICYANYFYVLKIPYVLYEETILVLKKLTTKRRH